MNGQHQHARMLRVAALAGAACASLAAGGCASGVGGRVGAVVDQAAAARAAAPDWFKARQVELEGKAYPSLYDAPPAPTDVKSDTDWEIILADLKADAAQTFSAPEAARPAGSEGLWAELARAEVAKGLDDAWWERNFPKQPFVPTGPEVAFAIPPLREASIDASPVVPVTPPTSPAPQ
jgi:hypothetical protein